MLVRLIASGSMEPRRQATWIRFVLVMCLTLLGIGYLAFPAHAASSEMATPANPDTGAFTGASPSFDEPSAYAKNYNLGDWGVSEQRGAATYTFPIVVPPGRNGMAPDLALRYSSESALRGGLAVGWRFDVPSISLDRSRGHEATSSYLAELRGASGRLVQVPDLTPFGGVAYRAGFDGSFTRFFNRPVIEGA
jgi:hypothetical protein